MVSGAVHGQRSEQWFRSRLPEISGATVKHVCGGMGWKTVHAGGRPRVPRVQAPLLGTSTPRLISASGGAAAGHDDADEGYMSTNKGDATLLECLSMVDFWLLTFAMASCTGASLAFINNVGPLVETLRGDLSMTVRPLP